MRIPYLQPWPKTAKIGQGTLYAPEANVPREARREFDKGTKALRKKDIKGAEEHLLKAIELFPKFSSAYDALGLAYQNDPAKTDKRTGANIAAKDAFKQALALDPGNDYALANLGYALLAENSAVEAERVLRMAAAIRYGSARTCSLLMTAQVMQRHYDEVLATAKKIHDFEEDEYPIIYFLRGVAWEGKSDREKAMRDYREFLKRSPEARQAAMARAALERLQIK